MDVDDEFAAAMAADLPGQEPAGPSRWSMLEEQLLAEVMARCEQLAVACVHVSAVHHNRRRQNLIGFPDLFLCGPGGVAFRELKREGGWLRPTQTNWKYRLLAAGQDWGVWQPSDLETGKVDKELAALARR